MKQIYIDNLRLFHLSYFLYSPRRTLTEDTGVTATVAGAATASTVEVRTGEEAMGWVEAGARGRTSPSKASEN